MTVVWFILALLAFVVLYAIADGLHEVAVRLRKINDTLDRLPRAPTAKPATMRVQTGDGVWHEVNFESMVQ